MAINIHALSKKSRLIITICISFTFFLLELVFGFRTGSLALIADAFHYLNDLIGFAVALAALLISERDTTPKALSFGWQRGQLLGGFFNGVFLLALGISIFLQSIERFVDLQHVDDPKIVLILGSVGLFLNIVTLFFLHEHGHCHDHNRSHALPDIERCQDDLGTLHFDVTEAELNECEGRHRHHRHTTLDPKQPTHDLGMLGVILHVVGDAVNNIGVMVAALVIWKAEPEARFYADPAVSLFIAIMIFVSALPLVKHAGFILLQTAPPGVDVDDIQHDLENIPGVESIHELHVWRLNERKAIASVHVVVSDRDMPTFIKTARHINECLHAYGIHSTTLQPELPIESCAPPSPIEEKRAQDIRYWEQGDTASSSTGDRTESQVEVGEARSISLGQGGRGAKSECQLVCTKLCGSLMCCPLKGGSGG